MVIVKSLHVLFVFIWIGNLLSLTRFMGYHVKEDEKTQMRLAKLYDRMYNYVGIPTMIISITLGFLLIIQVDQKLGLFWFFHKLAFVLGLVICDVVTGHYIAKLNVNADKGKGISYKVLHGLTGLLLIGVLGSVYLLRNNPN